MGFLLYLLFMKKIILFTFIIVVFISRNKEERILLIYGYGHVWQLSQFFNESPDYEYLAVNNYLRN